MAQRSSGVAARLSAPSGRWIFRNPAARLWTRPWLDRLLLHTIVRWYLPVSRAWAAGLAADGSVERFWEALPGEPVAVSGLDRKLAVLRNRRAAHEAADQAWDSVFFRHAPPDAADLVEAENRRRGAARDLMDARRLFLPSARRNLLPPVKWDIAGPDALAQRHGDRLRTRDAAFPPPSLPEIALSNTVPGADGEQFWLRFPSPGPAAGGDAWAHVYRPPGILDPPTLIFLPGICVESEFWPDAWDPYPPLVGRGVRVIRPEAPWHGRRRLAGHYGGEPVLARGPRGLIELFQAWVSEAALLIAWARQNSRGKVAVAGLSLGALTGQLIASAAAQWPSEMRPDAVLLVTTTGDLAEMLRIGGLGPAIGMPQQMAAAGWTPDAIAPWLPLAEPGGAVGLPADRILMVLGSEDDVTPFSGGLALADKWGLPRQNRFIWRRGHFSAGLAVAAEPAPLHRLLALLV